MPKSPPARRLVHALTASLLLTAVLAPACARAAGLDELVAPGAKVQKVAGGFQFTEGPAFGPQGFLLFSDILADHIMKLLPDGSTEVFLDRSDGANGLMFDPAGRLHACQGKGRRVVRIDIDGGNKLTVLADTFEGKKLNSPNDLALDPQGGVYFTDPRYGGNDPVEQPVMGVYYIDPTGKVSRVIEDLERPNGIRLSPDAKRLHVANPDRRELYRYDIEGPGKLAGKKLLFTGDEGQDGEGPDGMAVDERGNIFAAYKGIVVLGPEGDLLGRIAVPEQPANCTFGGPGLRTLYITARTSLYALETRTQGMTLLGPNPEALFRRSDVDLSGVVELTDVISLLNFLYLGGDAPPCPDAADEDDSGVLELTDVINILGFLYLGGAEPPAPGPFNCGPDSAGDTLGPCGGTCQ